MGEGFEGLAEADFGGFEEGLLLGIGFLLGVEAGFELALALEKGEFGVVELADLVVLPGGPDFEVGDILQGSALAFFGAGPLGVDLAAHEEPGEEDAEEESGGGGNVGGVLGEKFHGEIVPCGMGRSCFAFSNEAGGVVYTLSVRLSATETY